MSAHLPSARRRRLPVGAALVGSATLIGLLIAVAGLSRGDYYSLESGGHDSTFLELLGLIPDRQETRFDLFLVDYDRLFAALDLRRPEKIESGDALLRLRSELLERLVDARLQLVMSDSGAPGYLFALGPYSLSDHSSDLSLLMARSRGYVFAGRDLGGLASESGQPEFYEAVTGDFKAEEIAGKVSTCANCGVTVERRTYYGSEYVAWGEDFQPHLLLRLEAPGFDELGRSHRLAASSTYLMRTLWSEGIERMLDAASGRTPSLANNGDFALMVRALDSLEAISAYVSDCTVSRARVQAWIGNIHPSYREEAASHWTVPDGEVILKPYKVYAIATGFDGSPFTSLLLLHDTPELAQANVERLRQRLETVAGGRARLDERHPIIEVAAWGRLLVAHLRGVPDRDVVWQNSPLLLHE